VDILGDADSERYVPKAIEIAAQDPNSDGLQDCQPGACWPWLLA
jgi:hypothetical protein